MLKPNNYIHRISKDLLQWMPVAAFEGEVIVVDQPEMVDEAVAYLRTQKVLGVDTEVLFRELACGACFESVHGKTSNRRVPAVDG